MNRPEKKEIPTIEDFCPKIKTAHTATEVMIYTDAYNRHILPLQTYNQCHDEFEKFLPTYKNILALIKNPPMKYPLFQGREQPNKIPIWECRNPELLAKAIHKRLRGAR